MKKFVCVLLLCLLVLSVTACSNTVSFESADAMMAHMEGMWMIDSVQSEKEYYIFQGGTIYAASDEYYQSAVQHALNEIATNGKKEVFPYQTFDVVSERLYVEDIGNVENYVTLEANKGMIILHEGKDYEKRIEISQDGVLIKNKGEKNGLALIKIADAPDFKTDHFRELFQAVRSEWTVPTERFLCTTEEYLTPLTYMHSVIQNFSLIEQSNGTSVYTLGGIVDDPYGALILSEESITFFYGEDYKGDLLCYVEYQPKGNYNIMITDRTKSDLGKLLLYTVPVLENIPGAYSDVSQILELYEQQSTVSNGVRSLDVTVEGITYSIVRTTDNVETIITITLPEKISVPEKSGNPSDVENTTPTEPEAQTAGLFGKLDYDTVWVADYTLEGWTYQLYFLFEESGKCYFALGDTQIWGAGMGYYTIEENNTLTMTLRSAGKDFLCCYQYDSSNNSLIAGNTKLIVGDPGDVYILEKHPDQSYVDRVKQWGESGMEEYADIG